MALVLNNNKGFSLVELMIAIVILMFSLLGLLAVMVNSINANATNEVRNTAVRLTNQTAEALLALSFTDNEVAAAGAGPACPAGPGTNHTRTLANVNQDLRGFPQLMQNIRGFQQLYNISWCVTDLNTTTKQISILVTYTYGNTPFTQESIIFKYQIEV